MLQFGNAFASYDLPDALILGSGCAAIVEQLRASKQAHLFPHAHKHTHWDRSSLSVSNVPVNGAEGIQVRPAILLVVLPHGCILCLANACIARGRFTL